MRPGIDFRWKLSGASAARGLGILNGGADLRLVSGYELHFQKRTRGQDPISRRIGPAASDRPATREELF